MSSPPKKSDTETTSFAALSAPAYDPKAAAKRERERKKQKTDFRSLKRELGPGERRREGKTPTDLIIDAAIPVLIFLLVLSVLFFLLDVRFIYTAREHGSLRAVAFFLVMGVVALNRLIASDNTGESVIYVAGLAMVTALYTAVTSTAYEAGSLATRMLNTPGWAVVTNMIVAAMVWWVTNRLVHECCVDENRSAGEIGVVAGTLRNFRRSIATMNAPKAKKSWKDDYLLPTIEIQPYDPHDFKPDAPKPSEAPKKATERLTRRHPGVSIFYFTVPALAVFSLGLPVLMRGGDKFVLAGHMYVAIFVLASLTLLLLTSLGGIRAYFRARRVSLPANIGPFWAGLGLFMVLVVAIGAYQMPRPRMPHPAYVEHHEIDPWASMPGEVFELTPLASSAAEQVQQSKIIDYVSQGVLVILVVFVLYSAARGITLFAGEVARHADRYPRWLVWFLQALDKLLERLITLPEPRKLFRQGRPSAANALSMKFRSPMAGEGLDAKVDDVRRYVAHAFDALCALGEDLGRPRRRDETPYEFLRHLPRELTPIKKEAGEIIEMYVRSAYSPIPPDAAILDRLRKFWFEYARLRGRYIR